MYRKNTAGQFICVQLLLTATGAIANGLTPTARRCIDGTFAAATGTFTEDTGTGSYKFALSQADTNGNDISIIVTATGAIPVCVNFVTTAADPTDAVRFGLTALPNAAAEAAGGLYTRGSGAGQIAQQANGQADVNLSTIKTQTVTCAAGVTVLASVGTAATSTAQTGDNFARLGAPAGASVSADVAAVKAETATILADTNDIQTRLPAALVSGRMDSSVGAMAAATITAAAIATDAIDADALAADAVAEIQSGLATAANLAIVAGYIDTEIGTIITNVAAVKSDTAAILLDTGTDGVVVNAAGLATDAVNEIADGILNRDMSTGTDSGSPTVRTMRQALRFLRNKWSISGTTITITKEDDTTASWTSTVTGTAGADPITSSDPA